MCVCGCVRVTECVHCVCGCVFACVFAVLSGVTVRMRVALRAVQKSHVLTPKASIAYRTVALVIQCY